MEDKKQENEIDEQNKAEQPKSNSKVYFYAAIAACVLGVVSFGLAFSVLKIYSLIASVVFFLAALALLGTQKKVNNFVGVLFLKVIAYVLLVMVVLFFIGGIIFSALA